VRRTIEELGARAPVLSGSLHTLIADAVAAQSGTSARLEGTQPWAYMRKRSAGAGGARVAESLSAPRRKSPLLVEVQGSARDNFSAIR